MYETTYIVNIGKNFNSCGILLSNWDNQRQRGYNSFFLEASGNRNPTTDLLLYPELPFEITKILWFLFNHPIWCIRCGLSAAEKWGSFYQSIYWTWDDDSMVYKNSISSTLSNIETKLKYIRWKHIWSLIKHFIFMPTDTVACFDRSTSIFISPKIKINRVIIGNCIITGDCNLCIWICSGSNIRSSKITNEIGSQNEREIYPTWAVEIF